MAQYIIRVELKDASYQDYELLHKEMADRQFYKQIEDDQTGIWYRLPQAEYHYKGSIDDRKLILDGVAEAISVTGRKFEILITTAKGIIWSGLDKA
jgi:hypothetical protein